MCIAENLVLAVADLGNMYSGINPTKSPVSGAGNVIEPWLMSQVGRVRELVCAYVGVFQQPERWR